MSANGKTYETANRDLLAHLRRVEQQCRTNPRRVGQRLAVADDAMAQIVKRTTCEETRWLATKALEEMERIGERDA
jgi:glutathione S-transferase